MLAKKNWTPETSASDKLAHILHDIVAALCATRRWTPGLRSRSRVSSFLSSEQSINKACSLGGSRRRTRVVVTATFAVRRPRSQRLQASSASRSGRRGGVAERASDRGGEIFRVREVRLSLPANVQGDRVRLRSFRRNGRFEGCGFVFVFWVVVNRRSSLELRVDFPPRLFISGLSPGRKIWLKC